jgi:hypothetical protein
MLATTAITMVATLGKILKCMSYIYIFYFLAFCALRTCCAWKMFYILHSGGVKQSGEPLSFPLKKFSPSLTGSQPTMVMNTSKTCPYFSGSMKKCILPKQALTVSAIHMAVNSMPVNSHWLRRRLKCLRQLSTINHTRILCRPEASTA